MPCRRIQVDELWSYLYAKEKNAGDREVGAVWVWRSVDVDGDLRRHEAGAELACRRRGVETAVELFRDLGGRLANRAQIKTDGLASYFEAVPYVFGEDVDFAAVVKLYGDPEHAVHVVGRPNPDHINTCFVERHNLT